VAVKGNIVPLLELGSGFNPEFTGIENIYFYNTIMGYSRKATDAMLDQIIAFAEIGDFIHQPLKTYSSGMRARLAFAVAVNIDPDILILDEVLSVGDELFRRKSFAKIEEFFKADKTILFVSHSVAQINQLCSRALMIHQGRFVLDGPPKFVTTNYSKFIYSDVHKQRVLLNDFDLLMKQGLETTESEEDVRNSDISSRSKSFLTQIKDTAHFLPNFVSKSQNETINVRLKVRDFQINTVYGQQVNVLIPNEEYIFRYQIIFEEDLSCLNYGIGFKTVKGVPVSWRLFPGRHRYLKRSFHKGDVETVEWKFKCLFIPGTYFLNVSIRQVHDGEPKLVYKGADILAFKVIGDEKVEKGGIADVDICPQFGIDQT
jgi:lipopolysaccharide transport system ATP-binding protein